MEEIFIFKTLLLDDRSLCEPYEFTTDEETVTAKSKSSGIILITARFTSHSYVNVSQRLHIFSEFKFKQSVG